MTTIQERLSQIAADIREEVKNLYGVDELSLGLDFPPDTVDADFTFPCFPLAPLVSRPPNEIAKQLAAKFAEHERPYSVAPLGPYLNFTLPMEELVRVALHQAADEGDRFGRSPTATGAKILVEYSSPNTNKPLHLGHVRNNTLGIALTNILRAAGNEVLTACIFNDRGIHICKAMVAYRRLGQGDSPERAGMKGDHFVGKYYVLFDRELQQDPSLLDEAQECLRRWEAGDAEVRALWRQLNSWALEGMWQTYRRMGCSFDLTQYESDTYLLGRDIVRQGLETGIFTRKEDGSVWADLTRFGLDEKVVLRSDGTSVYVTQDLGTAVERFEKYHLNQAIYVVASEQNYHFQALFSIFKLLTYPWAGYCRHFNYGMVYLPEGKMKSREGKVVDADDLLEQMKAMARQTMAASGFQFAAEEWDAIAEMIAQGAIKYYILKVSPKKDIHFDPQESLAFEGATGAYLQYTHARICSIFRKAGAAPPVEFEAERILETEEKQLLRLLWRFPDAIGKSAAGLNPAKLAHYLWEIAKAFNQFYTQRSVLSAATPELTQARLALCNGVRITLQNGLALLGIQAPDKM